MNVELMDTTLRDGEQTAGVAFAPEEKLNLARMLLSELKVDRIEVASALVSQGEFDAVKKITSWAETEGLLNRVEVLGLLDGEKSIAWIYDAGARVVNLLCKGSLKHLTVQLRKTPEEHFEDIRKSLWTAGKRGIQANLYLEDWSNGMKASPEYVYFLLDALKDAPIQRFMLPDTLGILHPDDTYRYCTEMVERYPDVRFDFHGHNDYDLAVANSYAAVKAGVHGLHATVNGLGERTGNTTLSSIIAVLKDHLNVNLSVDESCLKKISRMVEAFTGIRVPENKPVLGEYVFTQCCGVHADGDNKGNLYTNTLDPERFGRTWRYALGKTSGKASIEKNLKMLGITLDDQSLEKVTRRVVALGDQKESITPEDLPYVITDVLGSDAFVEHIRLKNYSVSHTHGEKPKAVVCIEINGQSHESESDGDGQYDAFMGALRKIYHALDEPLPVLVDYKVSIPPGGRTDALVKTVITWEHQGRKLKTQGLHTDQIAAAVMATMRMLNII